jgi:hypothetical protein
MKREDALTSNNPDLPAGYPEFISELKEPDPDSPNQSGGFNQSRTRTPLLADGK